jgi:hypothetical protein
LVPTIGLRRKTKESMKSLAPGARRLPPHHITIRYVASHVDDSLRPYSWYRDLVLDGAEAIGLPIEWIVGVRAVDVLDDPDEERAGRARRFLSSRAT